MGIRLPTFNGKWISNADGNIYIITGREVICEGTGGRASFSADGESLMGCRFDVSSDNSTILWTDGDRWMKVDSIPSSSVGLGSKSPQVSEWPFGAVPGGPGHRILTSHVPPSSPPLPPDLIIGSHHSVTPIRNNRQISPPCESPDREIAAAALLASVGCSQQLQSDNRYASALNFQTGTESRRSSLRRIEPLKYYDNPPLKAAIMSPVPKIESPIVEVVLPEHVSPLYLNRTDQTDTRLLLQSLRFERQQAVEMAAVQNAKISQIDEQINSLLLKL